MLGASVLTGIGVGAAALANRPLAAEADVLTGLTPGPVTIPVLANDTVGAIAGDALTVVLVGANSQSGVLTNSFGTWQVNASNQVVFTPAASYDFSTPATASYYLQLSHLGQSQTSNTVSITLSFNVPVTNPVLTANPITRSMLPWHGFTIQDFAGKPYTITVSGGTNGDWSVDTSNDIVFKPNATTDYTMAATANYTLTYQGASASSTISATFVPYKQPPSVVTAHADYNQATVTINNIIGLLNDPAGTVILATSDPGNPSQYTNPVDGAWNIVAMGSSTTVTYKPSTSIMTGKTRTGASVSLIQQFDIYAASKPFTLEVLFNQPGWTTNPLILSAAPYTFNVAADAVAAVPANTIDSATIAIIGFAPGQTSPSITSLTPKQLISSDGTWQVVGDGTVTFTRSATLAGNPAPVECTISDNQGNPSVALILKIT